MSWDQPLTFKFALPLSGDDPDAAVFSLVEVAVFAHVAQKLREIGR